MKTMLYVMAFIQLAFAGNALCVSDGNQAVCELAVVKQYVASHLELERIRAEKNPDWATVNARYEMTLPVIKSIDAKYGTRYEKEIRDALKKCAAGDKIKINGQIVGKGFQHVTVLAIQQELDFAASAKQTDIKASAERIVAYFEDIRPTFVRRDKGFFDGKKTLEAAADAAIEQLSKSNKNNLLTTSRELEDVIARTYALSVLYEIEELEKKRDSDVEFCDVKKIEAAVYYRIIQPRIEKRSPRTNEIILNMLNGSYGAINSQEMERYMSAGLAIKLR